MRHNKEKKTYTMTQRNNNSIRNEHMIKKYKVSALSSNDYFIKEPTF